MYHPEENSAGVIECVCNWDLVDDECELPLIFTSQICTAGFFEAESQDGCKEC